MKVWVLLFWGEGTYSRVHVFKEDNPPSMQRVEEILRNWGETYDLKGKIEAIKNGGEYFKSYESLSLTLMDME